MAERHVLGISGGKDSAALAVYMRDHHPEIDIEYFFTDTGEELPEVYEFLGRLEGYLGKPIARLNPRRNFRFWLREYNHFLPNPQTRWCTRMLKLAPFEQWVKPWLAAGDKVTSYVAIRADEDYREGYSAKADCLFVKLASTRRGSLTSSSPQAWATQSIMSGAPAVAARFASSSKKSNGFGSKRSTLKSMRLPRHWRKTPWSMGRPSLGPKASRSRTWSSQSE